MTPPNDSTESVTPGPTPKQGEQVRTIFACVEPGCDYWRDEMSTGVHMTTNPEKPHGAMVRHKLVPLPVIPAVLTDELVEKATLALVKSKIGLPWSLLNDETQADFRDTAVRVLEAAGFSSPVSPTRPEEER
jgi:hypothetical protein